MEVRAEEKKRGRKEVVMVVRGRKRKGSGRREPRGSYGECKGRKGRLRKMQ